MHATSWGVSYRFARLFSVAAFALVVIVGFWNRVDAAASPVARAYPTIKFEHSAGVTYGAAQSVEYVVESGKNRALVVCEYTLNDTSMPPLYDGVPMSFVAKSVYHGVANQGVAAYVMVNPPVGSHSLELRTSAGSVGGFVASYTGVDQSNPVEVSSNNVVSFEATITDSVNTTTPGDWLVMCTTDSQNISGGVTTSGVVRESNAVPIAGILQDTDGGVAAGANPMYITNDGGPSTYISDVLFALKPACPGVGRQCKVPPPFAGLQFHDEHKHSRHSSGGKR